MRVRRFSVSIAALALALANLPLAAPLVTAVVDPICGGGTKTGPSSNVYTCTYTTTGSDTFTVPPTVSSISVDMVGGKGGNSGGYAFNQNAIYFHGGFGARVVNTITGLAPGASLTVTVAGNGGQGGSGTGGQSGTGGAAGYGGGGQGGTASSAGRFGGGGGGGASSVKNGSTILVMAGGGGGSGGNPGLVTYANNGGSAGNSDGSGNNGGDAGIDPPHCNGGAGATVNGGGAGGNGTCSGDGGLGSSEQGGTGGSGIDGAGGGGGGGRFGGGGGEADACFCGSGGGGGSSLVANGTPTITTDNTGVPIVKISWTVPFPTVSGAVINATTTNPWAGTETTGAQAKGSASITPINDVTPTGTLTYYFYSTSNCTGSPLSTEQVNLSGGTAPDSLATGALSAGSYSLLTFYNGDSNYAANGECDNFDVDSPPVLGGEGSMSASIGVVSAGQKGRTITFTYTAADTMTNGVVRLTVPSGWSAPSTTATAAGRSTASTGTVSISSRTIVVSGVNLATSGTLTIVYGSKTGGGPGAVATLTPGAQSWTAEQYPTNSGSPAALAVSPSITVYAKDGSGTNSTPTTSARKKSFKTIVFTYTAAAGGMANGSVTLKVPTGWTAPTLTSSANGFVQASAGTVSISGRVITVSNLTLSGGATLTITYGSTTGGGSGGKAPLTAVGLQTWKTKEKSTSAGVLTALAASPKIRITS